jgi:hypothetical protein
VEPKAVNAWSSPPTKGASSTKPLQTILPSPSRVSPASPDHPACFPS